jgi:hypothetical protein
MLRTKKFSTMTPKPGINRISKVGITMMMATLMIALLLVTSASVIVPAQATILPQRDLPIAIPEPDEDNGDSLEGEIRDCLPENITTLPFRLQAVLNCITGVGPEPDGSARPAIIDEIEDCFDQFAEESAATDPSTAFDRFDQCISAADLD